MLLARWYQTAKQMAQSDPRLASGAGKVADGIQEMQTAMVSPAQPSTPAQQPQY
jgi:X-X-X-Leu-X-X-Gly heptad repeat protein